MSYSRMTGLGTLWVVDASGNTIDCDAWSNLFNSACWGFGQSISSLPAGSTIPAGPAGGATPPTGTITPTGTVDCTQAWNALTSSECSFTSFAFWPVLAIGGTLALLLVLRK